MKIYINNQILDRFREEEINLDYVGTVMIILMCLYENDYETLDNIDDKNKSKRLLLLYRYLYRKDLLEIPEEGIEPNIHYILSPKGLDMVKFMLKFDNDEIHKESLSEILDVEDAVHEKPLLKRQIEVSAELKWVQDWLDLFPSGIHRGRTLKTNFKDCAERMAWFLANYPYDKDHIMRATKEYISGYAMSPDRYDYMRNSTYFIYKGRPEDRTSDLASACEALKDQPKGNNFNLERDSA